MSVFRKMESLKCVFSTFKIFTMRILSVLFLLISGVLFSQPLTVKIESITFKDSVPELREFQLKYSIKNNTSDTLKMFIKPNNSWASAKDEGSQISYYKIFENDSFIDIGSIFTTNGQVISGFIIKPDDSIKTQEDFNIKYVKYLSKQYSTPLDSLQKIYKKEGMESLYLFEGKQFYTQKEKQKMKCLTLNPNEQRESSIILNWDKNRYFKRDSNEYYLDEKTLYNLEITLVVLKEEFQDKIDEEVYKKLIKDPHFIKGVFVSNKVEINLKP